MEREREYFVESRVSDRASFHLLEYRRERKHFIRSAAALSNAFYPGNRGSISSIGVLSRTM